ncbi:hypothetical protein SteCoe_1568 [Stentor coeruleus]|uniref:Uncharacterized protein n=1 Tax=Stentor coeruleus TaxID=5963 RepID=A0A1R2D1R0_9CILI|nr:hypothetical protein SteCoe_1568 [Stentor coeruleus]
MYYMIAGVISSTISMIEPCVVSYRKVKINAKNKAAVLFFTSCLGIGIIIQVATSVTILVYKEGNYLSQKIEECDDIFKTIKDAYDVSTDLLCSIYCPCNVTNLEVLGYVNTIDYINGSAEKIDECNPCEKYDTYTDEQKNDWNKWTSLILGFGSSNDCNIEFSFIKRLLSYKIRYYLKFFEYIEKSFECSGFCTDSQLHIFANINEGLSKRNCASAILKFFEDMYEMFGLPAIVFSFIQVNFI